MVKAQKNTRARKGEETRQRILDEAHRLMKEEGVGGLTMRSVASRLDMRLSNVQYYFPQLRDLLSDLFVHFIDQDVSAFTENLMTGSGSPEQRLEKAVRKLLSDDAYLDDCNLFMSEVALVGRQDEKLAAALRQYYEGYLIAARTIVETLKPDAGRAETDEKAFQIVALLEGTLRLREPLASTHKGKLVKTLTNGILKVVA